MNCWNGPNPNCNNKNYYTMCPECLKEWHRFTSTLTANQHDHNCHAWGCQ